MKTTREKSASVNIRKAEAERYIAALADILCWMQGFKAAGGQYSGDLEGLRDLNIKLKEADRNV